MWSSAFVLFVIGLVASNPLPTNTGGGGGELGHDVDPYDEHLASEDGGRVEDSHAAATDLSDVELMAEDEEDDAEDSQKGGQHFFPSFAPLFSSPPLGHSRPHSFDETPHARPSYSEPHYRYRTGSRSYPEDSDRVLGSGNFGVIKGGTYYAAAGDDPDDYDSQYYRGNNGHGRPPYFRGNPQPPYRHGGDFFAGFRDFADITTPAKPAYSQYFVVYANRNATRPHPSAGPNNIFEQLALLDQVQPKVSKNKKKLAAHKEKMSYLESKKKLRSPKEAVYEPLLALS